jgi:NAD(P)-dependent dehydrogenase (short-subunit alcohol dehydrogenase family)
MHPKLQGMGAVVTGAGHGIGRALAIRLAAEGARVVVNDLDALAAHQVARKVAGTAAPGDCATREGVASLVAQARDALGRIDIFCANAGIDSTQVDSLMTPDHVWARMFETNVMSHVRTAQAVVPGWLADGKGGRFVVTASAAGLLSAIGAAPYSVTKHASIGFAEWLSITYGDRGVRVQAICPQSVSTRMLEEAGPVKGLLPADETLSPEDVVDSWVAALDDDRFFVLPHPNVARYYAARATDPDRWLAGMRRLQRKVDELPGRTT